ncbi:MAG: 30S ribosomal protein S18 [Elusimicrobia bacterium]|nr:30S ribosomal protein S18 [Elusimicrobiota bacterium]
MSSPETQKTAEAPAPAASTATAAPSSAATAARPRRPEGRRPFVKRRKVCRFCAEKIRDVDFKQIPLLRSFLSETGKIISGRTTGNCAKHQRGLTRAVKRARNLSLLPYTSN